MSELVTVARLRELLAYDSATGVFTRLTSNGGLPVGSRGKKHHLGYFADPKEAHRHYEVASKEMFGEFARSV